MVMFLSILRTQIACAQVIGNSHQRHMFSGHQRLKLSQVQTAKMTKAKSDLELNFPITMERSTQERKQMKGVFLKQL